jgi:hypothetical protein
LISGAAIADLRSTMFQQYIARLAACLEIVVGITLILVPEFACQLLFAAPLTGDGVPITRFAGIGLLSLGIAYWSTRTTSAPRGSIFGLLVFNMATAMLFAWVGMTAAFHGILLWPAVLLHSGIGASLVWQFSRGNSLAA